MSHKNWIPAFFVFTLFTAISLTFPATAQPASAGQDPAASSDSSAQNSIANPSAAFIQRTMKKIAESTPEHPATVRFQFYGQSITAQAWTKRVSEDLAKRFPSVNFVFHNPAIGGFTSPALIRTAEHDLYPWYPDILVFHVYGPVDKYEEIIRKVRATTTAEIVLWTSHLSAGETLDKNPDADARIMAIRQIAKKYDCMLIDVRKKWIAYIKGKNLEPKVLLRDSVHLNNDGIALMTSFVAPEFVYRPELATTAQAGKVTEIPSESSPVKKTQQGDTVLEFTGNRVVAIAGPGGQGAAEVLLDGQPMAAKPELWAHTRPSTGPKNWMPAIKQISFEKALVTEDWALTCLPDSTPDGKKIHFKLTGSVTGEDGEGYNDARFVSPSGRVVIGPEDWHLAWILGYVKTNLPDAYQIKWKSYPLFTAKYEAKPAKTETVLVQNCSNGPHTLTIKGSARDLGIVAFRIQAPAAAERTVSNP